MSVCVLLATHDRYAACGFSSLFLCIHVSTSVQTAIAEKLTGFHLTKTFRYCMQPELSVPYIVLGNKIKILRSLKSVLPDFKDLSVTLRI